METDPYLVLLEFDQRCHSNAAGLPAYSADDEEWVGIGFRIGKDRVISAMNEVSEILELPEYTEVPGVKSWMVGVANVRGSLITLMDLRGFVYGADMANRKNGRVIVIDYKGFQTGLIVEEVIGMRHFHQNHRSLDVPEVDGQVQPYIDRAFKNDTDHWPVFSFRQLKEDARFARASL